MRYAVVQLPAALNQPLVYTSKLVQTLRHSAFAWLGLRPAAAQHTAAEHAAFGFYATGRSSIVEIGVAEGVSALAVREKMEADGTLYLIDPFHLSRVPALNFIQRTALRVVGSCPRGQVVWMQQFSSDAAKNWNRPIDLLVIDGDHAEAAVQDDWETWSRFVVPGGLVMFHDANLFAGGWTTPDFGPLRVVNRLFRSGQNSPWKIVNEIDSIVVVQREA
ncbi:MAG TPA: class I SAM-dependent methyltransferase [Candidatus Acidoferrales bacterium]